MAILSDVLPTHAGTEAADAPPLVMRRAPRRRIGDVLVAQGLLTAEQLQEALTLQQQSGSSRRRLGQVVVQAGMLSEREVANALAEALSLPLVDLGRTATRPEVVRLLPRTVAERIGVLVVARDGGKVTVAAADPTNVVSLDDVKLYTGASQLEVLVAPETQLRQHLARAWSLSEDSSNLSLLVEDTQEPEPVVDEGLRAVEAAPIVRLVDMLLADAVRTHASDIHLEPQRDELRVRYRVDGVLRDVMTVPSSAAAATVSRIKILSGLDIAERRRPQDGRARLAVDGAAVECRVSTLPALHGEKVVLRLLPPAEDVPLLHRTGLTPGQLDLLVAALRQPQGLILITGPTGSGKTNTMYASLQQVSSPELNVVTLEDPVEVQVRGITQVQVSERSGLTFARGLRSVLRQDPDVVLVGEVRDPETAELALKASLTGHLVLTTLHTNDAVSAVTRLVDMGIEPFLVASSLTLVVAQRLVRRPCAACAEPYRPSARTLSLLSLHEDDLEQATPRRGRGCTECGETGYRGRTGVFEVLPVTEALRRVLLTTPSEAAIRTAARAQEMLTLRASALAAAHAGETTYEEVLRTTSVDATSGRRCVTCTRMLAEDMLFCPYDRTPVAAAVCAGCQRQLDEDWPSCPFCRAVVVADDVERVEAAPRVLVVHPDNDARAAAHAQLAGAAQVIDAADADAALSAVVEHAVDAVLIRDRLPDLAAVELVRLLRNDPRTLATPILVVADDEDDRESLRSAGADECLVGDVDPGLLRERLLFLLPARRR